MEIRIPISDALHQALKVRAAQESTTLRELIERLLSEALGVKENK
jgi:predicted HicB family RNase H-like nuclease